MHVNVLISTWNRPKLLAQTVRSILAGTHKDVSIIIMVDGNSKLIDFVAKLPVAMVFNKVRLDWVRSMNKGFFYARGDAVAYASDDLVFDPHCIEAAVAKLKLKRPDGDGLVAITQNVKGCSTAFGLVGHRFIERFPKRQVLCPDYIHYVGDFELGRFARHSGRCYMCPESKVTHHRPHDATFHKAKPVERLDFRMKDARKAKGLLWGLDFELLSKKRASQ